MLLWMRIAAIFAASVTAMLLVLGDHPPEFVAADLIVVGALGTAAVAPARWQPMPWLVVGFAFAAGVFTVAFGASLAANTANWTVGAAAGASLVAMAAGGRTLRDR